jgi:hypothetical protein
VLAKLGLQVGHRERVQQVQLVGRPLLLDRQGFRLPTLFRSCCTCVSWSVGTRGVRAARRFRPRSRVGRSCTGRRNCVRRGG